MTKYCPQQSLSNSTRFVVKIGTRDATFHATSHAMCAKKLHRVSTLTDTLLFHLEKVGCNTARNISEKPVAVGFRPDHLELKYQLGYFAERGKPHTESIKSFIVREVSL